jgi:uncharacterized protein YqeY
MAGQEQTLRDDLKSAMRAKDGPRAQVLRTILAAAKNRAIELRVDALDEAEFIAVVKREAKQRAESLDFARKADREELIREHAAALAVVETYLPRQMSESDLRAAVAAVVAETGATGVGPVMKELTKRHAGRYDGKTASRIAAEVLKGDGR